MAACFPEANVNLNFAGAISSHSVKDRDKRGSIEAFSEFKQLFFLLQLILPGHFTQNLPEGCLTGVLASRSVRPVCVWYATFRKFLSNISFHVSEGSDNFLQQLLTVVWNQTSSRKYDPRVAME